QTSLQTGANFNIDGSGKAGIFDAATQYNLNGIGALKMNIPNGDLSQGSIYAGASAGTATANIGISNSFFGVNAGAGNLCGSNNSFFGSSAGVANQSSSHNSFFGVNAGFSNNGGENNSFFGESAGRSTVFGLENSFFGVNAGFNNKGGFMDDTGSHNTSVGFM